ncbi:MAG TPA: M20 family metallo-hydrolase [Pseudomonadota bacterium]|nr:M20 family metallo-hydrolase [Pseudomonadota bacterium]
MTDRLSVKPQRLWQSILALGSIGSYLDEGSGLRGVNRLALTSADGEGRRHVVEQMKALGLSVSIDRIGNVLARRSGQDDSLAPVMMGSHIDSVPTAGMFDGCLGVLGALEIIATLNDAGRQTLRPITVAFFTDEEGSRFGTDMLGSAVATGRIPLAEAYALIDRNGLSVKGELQKIGFLGEADERLAAPYAYLECHIEQGPVLRSANVDIGVVTGVQSISWHEVTIVGRSAHAGTTPMSLRADASVAASRLNLRLREMAQSGNYGPDMRATMGAMNPVPGLVNIVPGKMTVTVDLRNPDDANMRAAEADIIAFYEKVAREEGVQIRWRQTARTDCVRFDAGIQKRVSAAAAQRGFAQQAIVSGAGHDAQELAHLTRAAMVFVPGEFAGISHNPREFSTEQQCANGVNVMLDVVLSLADEK